MAKLPGYINTKPDEASFRESIVNKEKAGLLTCNIYTVLPGRINPVNMIDINF